MALAGIAGQSCPYNNCGALYNQYNGITNFQPRIGFAYTPGGGRFVIRGGYTLSNYLEGTGTNLRLPLNPPFAVEHDNNYTGAAFNQLPGSTLDQGFLPFTTNSRLPQSPRLVSAYLHLPLAWRFLGKQTLYIAAGEP